MISFYYFHSFCRFAHFIFFSLSLFHLMICCLRTISRSRPYIHIYYIYAKSLSCTLRSFRIKIPSCIANSETKIYFIFLVKREKGRNKNGERFHFYILFAWKSFCWCCITQVQSYWGTGIVRCGKKEYWARTQNENESITFFFLLFCHFCQLLTNTKQR